MIHLVKQYKQLFNFCLMANTDFGALALEYKDKETESKESAKIDGNKLEELDNSYSKNFNKNTPNLKLI